MSLYSSSLRIELITNGTQAGVWGTTTNDNLAYILDTSIAGYQTVSVTSASQALTHTSGPTATAANNQSVYAMLRFTTTTGAAFAVYAPPASKMYIIWNNSGYSMTIYNSTVIGNTTAAGTGTSITSGIAYTVATLSSTTLAQWQAFFSSLSAIPTVGQTITATATGTLAGGATVTATVLIANGSKVMVWSDGTSFYEVQASNITGTLAIANGGTGQTTANAALNALLPSQTSNANKYLQTDGTNASWDAISLSTTPSASVTSGIVYTVASLGSTTLAQWQAFFSALASVPTVGQNITATATGTIVGGATVTFIDVTGTLPVANGGTGQATVLTQYGVIYGSTTTAMATTLAGTSTQVLHGNSSGAPTWGSVALGADVSGTLPVANGGTGQTAANAAFNALAPSQAAANGKYLKSNGTDTSWDEIDISTSDITGTLAATNGGTGQSTVTTGDLLYGSATNTWAKLADVVTGNALISGGVGIAPLYGKIGLTTHVSGTLPVANGGTGNTSQSQYAVLYAATTSSLTGDPNALSFDGTNLSIGTNSSTSVVIGVVYTVASLGSTTLGQWQAFFSALASVPTVGQSITATATGTLAGGATISANKLTVLGTGSFTNSLVSTSATAADKPTFEFRKTRNTGGVNENNAIGRFSFYSQSGTTTTESAYIDVTDTRISSLSFPKISLVCYNQTTGTNSASLSLGGTQTRLFSGSSSGIDYDATSGEHTFSGDVVFNDAVTFNNAVTATTFSGQATSALIRSQTAQSASGTSVTFTGIPSGTKRVTVMFSTVSTNNAGGAGGDIQIQIGAGSYSTSGYDVVTGYISGSSPLSVQYSSGFVIANSTVAFVTYSGTITLTLIGSNTWTASGSIGTGASANSIFMLAGVSPGLGGALDRLRVTTAGGTVSFDAGTINILYE